MTVLITINWSFNRQFKVQTQVFKQSWNNNNNKLKFVVIFSKEVHYFIIFVIGIYWRMLTQYNIIVLCIMSCIVWCHFAQYNGNKCFLFRLQTRCGRSADPRSADLRLEVRESQTIVVASTQNRQQSFVQAWGVRLISVAVHWISNYSRPIGWKQRREKGGFCTLKLKI